LTHTVKIKGQGQRGRKCKKNRSCISPSKWIDLSNHYQNDYRPYIVVYCMTFQRSSIVRRKTRMLGYHVRGRAYKNYADKLTVLIQYRIASNCTYACYCYIARE